jgi:hypothetical protein
MKHRLQILGLPKDVDQVSGIEACRRIWESPAVTHRREDVGYTGLPGAPQEMTKHRVLDVENSKRSGRWQDSGQWQSMCAHARTNLENALAASRLQDLSQVSRRLKPSGKQQ